MKSRLIILFFVILLSSNNNGWANDSLKVFPFKDFYSIVLLNHPLVKQAFLLNEMAQKELRIARSEFDPKYDFDFTRKVFKGTVYYNYIDNGLKVPLWFGADLKSGFEQNTGTLVNPTNYTPLEGLWYVGLEFPIGKGMIIDERRAVVRQAQIATQISDVEKIKLINKIILNASKDYWEWFYQYHKCKQLETAYTIGILRFEGIKQRVINGDMASIDTTEALIQVQERWMEYQNAVNDLQNTEINLSNYLWSENEEPLQIENMRPEDILVLDTLTDSTFQKIAARASITHPDILKMNYKINQLKIDRVLKLNNMLPGISVGLKYLSTPQQNILNDINYEYAAMNYKAMVTLNQPLFLRKERGKYQLAKIKINQAEYEQQLINREVNTALKSAYNDVQTYKEMIQYQEKIYTNTKILFDGEMQKFDIGESSIFLVNSRENKLISTTIKTKELLSKYKKAIAVLYWSAGQYTY